MNSQRPQSLPVTETLDPLLGKMRCIATGLLVLMSFLYVLALAERISRSGHGGSDSGLVRSQAPEPTSFIEVERLTVFPPCGHISEREHFHPISFDFIGILLVRAG